ncbi:MAG: Rpp14/Pop5 family protein [Candidatus Aenigmatarchaeota archaeon]
MAEPKMLPPSMRPPKRYIVFEVISDQPIIYGELVNTIWTSTMEFLGELGGAEANIWFVHNTYDSKKQIGMIKCRHDNMEKVRTALSLISIISETKCIIKIIGVTGTIKSAKTKYLGEQNINI